MVDSEGGELNLNIKENYELEKTCCCCCCCWPVGLVVRLVFVLSLCVIYL